MERHSPEDKVKIGRAIERYLSEIGRRGGASRSKRKAEAARRNGRLGGRPPQTNGRELLTGLSTLSSGIIQFRVSLAPNRKVAGGTNKTRLSKSILLFGVPLACPHTQGTLRIGGRDGAHFRAFRCNPWAGPAAMGRGPLRRLDGQAGCTSATGAGRSFRVCGLAAAMLDGPGR
jgi:hypothetical protein